MSSYQGNATMSVAPQSYAEANAALGEHSTKKIGNNTWLCRDGEVVSVQLHDTKIVQFYPDGSIGLDTGGWNTPTTRGRMSAFLKDRRMSVCSNVRKGGLCLYNQDTEAYTPFPDGQGIVLPGIG